MKARPGLASILAALLLVSLALSQDARAADLKTLRIGAHALLVEVADTPATREVGLMQRTQLAPDHGMLFVFDTDIQACMWMKNTLIPLSVAFVDAGGRITNIADMQPQTLDVHCAQRPARYAIEANLHWFAHKGLGPGQSVAGLQ